MMAELTPPGFDNMVRTVPFDNTRFDLIGENSSSSVFTDCRTPHRR